MSVNSRIRYCWKNKRRYFRDLHWQLYHKRCEFSGEMRALRPWSRPLRYPEIHDWKGYRHA